MKQIAIGQLPMVCDFPEVFLYDINYLSSKREVEFTIELVPNTSLMSMAPYRKFDSELSELSSTECFPVGSAGVVSQEEIW